MATDVKFQVVGHILSREENGARFDVSIDGQFHGEMIISKGGVRWKRSGQHDHNFATWQQFASFMQDKPRK